MFAETLFPKNSEKSGEKQIQLNFSILNTDILNTIDMSKSFCGPNHLFIKNFTLDILIIQISWKFFLGSISLG
jgi:hypothetical protein